MKRRLAEVSERYGMHVDSDAYIWQLFVTLRQMQADGKGLIFISHKLHEVMDLSDEITVLRNGKVSGHTRPRESSREHLAELMVGRPVELTRNVKAHEPGEPQLTVDDLDVVGDRGNLAVKNLSLRVRSGEIVGVAGVSGNGQRELAEAINRRNRRNRRS